MPDHPLQNHWVFWDFKHPEVGNLNDFVYLQMFKPYFLYVFIKKYRRDLLRNMLMDLYSEKYVISKQQKTFGSTGLIFQDQGTNLSTEY